MNLAKNRINLGNKIKLDYYNYTPKDLGTFYPSFCAQKLHYPIIEKAIKDGRRDYHSIRVASMRIGWKNVKQKTIE